MEVNWTAYNNISDCVKNSLCVGEEKTLSDSEKQELNAAIDECLTKALAIQKIMQKATSRFANS